MTKYEKLKQKLNETKSPEEKKKILKELKQLSIND
jgi:hypothetical protein